MSIPHEPQPAKFVLSILSANWKSFWPQLQDELETKLGKVDYISPEIPFTQTTYYNTEMGFPIFRRLLGFANLRRMEDLSKVKLWTNTIENRFANSGNRTFNLDPGYLTLERLVLATGKNFTHRIYLEQGIWADLTLIFYKGNWTNLPWTFPDYATPEIQNCLTQIRTLYHAQIKELKNQKKENICLKV